MKEVDPRSIFPKRDQLGNIIETPIPESDKRVQGYFRKAFSMEFLDFLDYCAERYLQKQLRIHAMKLGVEVSKMHLDRCTPLLEASFYDKYMSGYGLDIGYKGLELDPHIETVRPLAIGIDKDTDSYDGLHLPIGTESMDYVHASHVLEHVEPYWVFLQEWFRVLKVGGHLVLFLPNAYLYEKALRLGGSWGSCNDHKRVYTPSSLLKEIEESLTPNTYRIRHFRDNDKNYDYSRKLEEPVRYLEDCFEIECVLQKIEKPSWDVK